MYHAPAPRVGALSNDARLTSVCLSRTSGLSREQRGLGSPQRSSTRASACGPTNSVYNGGLLGEAAELAAWYVNVIPPPTTTLPKAKVKLTRRTAHRFQSSARPGVVPLVLPLVAARLPHPSTILLQHLGVLTTSAITFLSHRRPARPTSTRPLRRHGALLHCRPTINHRILLRLQMILHRQRPPACQVIIITLIIPIYLLFRLLAVTPRARQHHD